MGQEAEVKKAWPRTVAGVGRKEWCAAQDHGGNSGLGGLSDPGRPEHRGSPWLSSASLGVMGGHIEAPRARR